MADYSASVLEVSGAADAKLSTDQTKLYVSRNGDIDVFDLNTHTNIATWHIGTAVGVFSMSEDGSYLLVSDPRQPLLYQVSTQTGSILRTYIGSGNAYSDVEVVNNTTALVSNIDAYSQAHPEVLDLRTGNRTNLTSIAVGTGFSVSGRETLTEDGHLTLIADGNSSGGPLHIFDDRVGAVTANGGTGAYNYGVQAISESANLVAVGIYGQGLALYDTDLHYLRNINLGSVNGVAFDPSGHVAYVYQTDSFGSNANVVEYDATTFNEIARYGLDHSSTTNSANVRYGDNLLATDDGRFYVVTDPGNGSITLIDKRSIYGGDGNDALAGSDQNDLIRGGSGHDVLHGRGGQDTLDGGSGNDHIYGQSPNGGADASDSISGGEGNDYLQGNAGSDTLDGGTGSDRINGGADGDKIIGGEGNDTVNGNLGNDTITGDNGNDSLRGGQGNDSIDGGANDDVLSGDKGVDTLTGGSGNDYFRFAPGDASITNSTTDAITDFQHGADHIQIGFAPAAVISVGSAGSLSTAHALAQASLDQHAGDHEVALVQVGSDTLLFWNGSGGSTIDSGLLLQGIGANVIAASDF